MNPGTELRLGNALLTGYVAGAKSRWLHRKFIKQFKMMLKNTETRYRDSVSKTKINKKSAATLTVDSLWWSGSLRKTLEQVHLSLMVSHCSFWAPHLNHLLVNSGQEQLDSVFISPS